MKLKSAIHWKLYWTLLAAGFFGTLAGFPYIVTLQADVLKDLPIPLATALVLSAVQSTVLIAVILFFGLLLAKKVGLGAPYIEEWLKTRKVRKEQKQALVHSAKLGAGVGVLIILLDGVFLQFMEPIAFNTPPVWQGVLASFYGGIVEELLLRLFFMTLLVWVFTRISKARESVASPKIMWSAIIVSAILFGLGHLPATATVVALTPVIIARAVLLSGVGGVLFGWLYWKRGLAAAMVAHFAADIVLHGILPLFI